MSIDQTPADTATRTVLVGDQARIGNLAIVQQRYKSVTAIADLPSDLADVTVIVPRVPASMSFGEVTDDDLDNCLGRALDDLASWVTAVVSRYDREVGGSIVLLLPAGPTLGEPGEVLAGSFCGAAISLARTLSIELHRERISVNTIIHAVPDRQTVAAIDAEISTLRHHRIITGQEIYITDGVDLERVHP